MKLPSPHAAVPKILTGITGFDEITYGGLPLGRSTLVMGGPGCGKTVFALQTLVNGARHSNEAGIFVAFEESSRQISANAFTFGWDLSALTKKKLFFLDAQLGPEVVNSGAFDLIGLLDLLRQKVEEIKATRVVFDGIDVLLSLLDDPIAERTEIYRIRDWMTAMGVTGIITQKVSGDGDQRYGFLQFMVDCVIVLRHQVVEGTAFRNLRILKYRGSAFLDDEFPISLTGPDAMKLTHRGPTELIYKVTSERVSTGLPRLDHMLSGGYHRGSNVLISGAPGTAKSTLAGLFALAACERGERTLYVSFDEGAAQIARNLESVGIRLAPHVKSGILRMFSTRTRGPNVDDQFGSLRTLVAGFKPRCLIIDPLSALATKLSHLASADAAQHFLDYLKGEGITVMNTSLLEGIGTDETTATGISTIADTWIHLSYHVHDGERNRALTIVKSRGTGHSNQVRELQLADDGVTLTDVFVAHGKVLMGVARWEWERDQKATRHRDQIDADYKRLQLQLAQAAAGARLLVIETEMEARTAEIALLDNADGSAAQLLKSDKAVLRTMRRADKDTGSRPRPRGPRTTRTKLRRPA